MKQEINLYQVEKQRFKFRLNFKEASYGFIAFFVVIFLITAVDLMRHFMITKEYSTLDKEQQAKSQKLQVIAGNMPEEKTRNEIVNEVKNYQDQNQSKTTILGLLASATSSKTTHYSDYLEALARKAIPGLWLTNIGIRDNGNDLSIEGKTLSPQYVPLLISGLGGESVFKGKTFEVFKISTDEKTGEISFNLETKASLQP
jgi:hypothetical protein